MFFYQKGVIYKCQEKNDALAKRILEITNNLNEMFAEESYHELPVLTPESFNIRILSKWDEFSRWN